MAPSTVIIVIEPGMRPLQSDGAMRQPPCMDMKSEFFSPLFAVPMHTILVTRTEGER